MCFKNLPIEFDENGKAKLLDTAADPYATSDSPIKQYVSMSPASNGASAGSAASTSPPRLSAWGTK